MAAQQMLYKSLKQKNQQKFPSGARPKDSAPRDGSHDGCMVDSMDWFCWENLNRKLWIFPLNIEYGAFRLKISLKQTNPLIFHIFPIDIPMDFPQKSPIFPIFHSVGADTIGLPSLVMTNIGKPIGKWWFNGI